MPSAKDTECRAACRTKDVDLAYIYDVTTSLLVGSYRIYRASVNDAFPLALSGRWSYGLITGARQPARMFLKYLPSVRNRSAFLGRYLYLLLVNLFTYLLRIVDHDMTV